MIPRRLALRIWSACLYGRADWLRGLTGEGAIGLAARHRPSAAEDARRKAHGRRLLADQLDHVGRTVQGWTGDDDRCHGADLEPEVVAWVCCYMAQTQHSCYEGQSSESQAVTLGR
jgi:hypothetical protein